MREPLSALPLLLIAASLAACQPAPDGLSGRYARHNLVLVTVDTLRADHLGVYGYARRTTPTLDSIAPESIVFERAFAPSGLTWPSLTAMLTSSYPRTTNVRKNGELLAEGVPTLLTALQAGGYTTAAFLANACNAFGAGLDVKRCAEDEEVTRLAIDWLAAAPPEPFLLWLHLKAPHSDYAPPKTFDVFARDGYSGPQDGTRAQLNRAILGETKMSAEDLEHVVALYDGEVLYADTTIGILWSELSLLGLLDRTVAVISADHGEDLGQHHGYFYHACSVHDSTLHIPLLLRLPDGAMAGARVGDLVANLDLAPTLLDLLQLPRLPGIAGQSLLPMLEGSAGGPDRVAMSEFYDREAGEILTLRTGNWRFVYNPKRITPLCEPEGDYYAVEGEELYDLTRDAGESRNILEDHPRVASSLREEVEKHYNPALSPDPIRVDRAEIRRLRALGYLQK